MKNGLLTALLLALIAPAALAEDELVDNPMYKQWAAFKPGSTAKVATTSEAEMNGEPVATTTTITQTLKEVTPEKAVVEFVVEKTLEGTKMTALAKTQEIPAKVPKDQVVPHPKGTTVTTKAEGDEELAVGGKKYKCHWQEFETQGEDTQSKQEIHGTVRLWTCPQVVGGVVKMQMTMDKPKKATTTAELLEFKAA